MARVLMIAVGFEHDKEEEVEAHIESLKKQLAAQHSRLTEMLQKQVAAASGLNQNLEKGQQDEEDEVVADIEKLEMQLAAARGSPTC